MMRSFIGAALALALASTHAEASARAHKAVPRRAAPVGLSIGKTALPGAGKGVTGHRFGAVLPTGNCNPNFVPGQVPPAATWNSAIGCAFPNAGGTLQGPLGLQASTTATAPLSIPPGTSPTTPSDGDVWATSSGLFARYGGSTVGPLGAGGGGGSNSSFLASGNYVNVPSVTVSANQSLSAFVGPNALLKNYGSTQIIFHAASTATTVTVATQDGMIEPGGTQEIALGTNAAIAVASVVNGAISGTGSIQIIDGSGLWTGSGGGSSGGSGSNASVSATGSAAPASATYMGMLLGSNLVGASGTVWGTAPTGLNVLGANVDVLASALPTGAATSAAQTTGNGSLSSIATNTTITAAGTSATSALPVQGVASMVPLRVRCPDDTTSCLGGSNASVGANTTTAPTSSTLNGYKDASGNTQQVSPTTPLPTTGGIIQATVTPIFSLTSATTQLLVNASGSTKVYVTAFHCAVQAGASATNGDCQLVQGTGSTCAGSTAALSPQYVWTPSSGVSLGGGLGPIFISAAGNSVCIKTTLASATAVTVGGIAATQQ